MHGKYKLTYKGASIIFDFDKYTYQDASCVYEISDTRFSEFDGIRNLAIYWDFYNLLKMHYKMNKGHEYDKSELERLTLKVMEYIEETVDEQVKIEYQW